MPDITYTVTEEWSEDTIRDWATFETRETPRLPIESKRIEACRPTAPISMLVAAAEGHDTPHLHHHRKTPT